MAAPSTVRPAGSGRRVVRRKRPALDSAYDVALCGLPVELRPLVRRYVENMRQGQEIRSELSTAMSACGLRWRDVDRAACQLL
jgi:hypothetical protein